MGNVQPKSTHQKAFVKRCVLRCVLKDSTVCGALRWSGRAFHSLGAAEQKARMPMVLRWVRGGLRRFAVEERRVREVVWGVRRSLR